MNFFGGDNGANNANILAAAKIEFDTFAEMYGKMASTCNKKCVTGYHDGELNVGEMTCVDRCVYKYLQASLKIREVVEKNGELMAKQAEAGAGMAGPYNKVNGGR
jgi:import inner membrane translocase subunit TIM10